MSQSLVKNYLHVVYSTRQRRAYLQNTEVRERMHAYLAGACRSLKSPSIIVGGVQDHVHILCTLSKTLSVSGCIQEAKRESSKWVKGQAPDLSQFHWQSGYGAFSISPSHVDRVRDYIGNQVEHHKRESFQDEFRRLLKKYDVEYDERYVWD